MPPLATLSDRARVAAANKVPAGDLLPSDLEHPEFSLEAYEAASLPPELSEWCFNLVRDNMRDTYIAASWPWDDAEKRKEMAEPGGRYFVARPRGGGDPAGMVYFQFLMEDDGDRDDGKQLCAAYCYEIQLVRGVRGRGLGTLLMGLLESAGKQYGMKKCMLTVLRANKQAVSFYQKLGYKIDPISPSKCLPKHKWKKIPYEIMSKPL